MHKTYLYLSHNYAIISPANLEKLIPLSVPKPPARQHIW